MKEGDLVVFRMRIYKIKRILTLTYIYEIYYILEDLVTGKEVDCKEKEHVKLASEMGITTESSAKRFNYALDKLLEKTRLPL